MTDVTKGLLIGGVLFGVGILAYKYLLPVIGRQAGKYATEGALESVGHSAFAKIGSVLWGAS